MGKCQDLGTVTNPSAGLIRLSWKSPIDTGGVPVLHYHLTYERSDRGGSVKEVVAGDAGNPCEAPVLFNIQKLKPNIFVIVKVKAIRVNKQTNNNVVESTNPIDNGPATVANFTTAATTTAPSPPLGFSVVQKTSSSFDLTWFPPLDEGGEPVTAYMVCYVLKADLDLNGTTPVLGTCNDVYPACVDGDVVLSCNHTLSGLAGGTTYRMYVLGRNLVGVGEVSEYLFAETLVLLGQPNPPQLVCASSSSLEFGWLSVGSNAERTIISYVVYNLESGAPVCNISADPAKLAFSCTASGLASETRYTFQFAIWNRTVADGTVGESPRSAVLPVWTTAPGQVFCEGSRATLELHYPNSSGTYQWHLSPPIRDDTALQLSFDVFDVECSYDRIRVFDGPVPADLLRVQPLWAGGCRRSGLALRFPRNISVHLQTDHSVGGVVRFSYFLQPLVLETFEVLPPTVLPGHEVCGCAPGRGSCSDAEFPSRCVCATSWWVGEDCGGCV